MKLLLQLKTVKCSWAITQAKLEWISNILENVSASIIKIITASFSILLETIYTYQIILLI
jgi:hypothetical protein